MPKIETGNFADYSFLMKPPTLGTTETLQYSSDVMTAHDGTENVKRNRPFARRQMDIVQHFTHAQARDPINLLRENIRGNWALPLWQQAQPVGTFQGTDITVPVSELDYIAGGSVLIYNAKLEWRVADILTKNDDGLTFTDAVARIENAYICPLVSAKIRGDADTQFKGNTTEIKLRYEAEVPIEDGSYFGIFISIAKGGGFDAEYDYLRINDAVKVVEQLKGFKENSNVKIDLGVGSHWTTYSNTAYLDAQPSDFDDAITYIQNMTDRNFTQLDEPFKSIDNMFRTDMPNDGTRRDFAFLIEQFDFQFLNDQHLDSPDLINSTGVFAPPRNVRIAACNMLSDDFTNYDAFYDPSLEQIRTSLEYEADHEFHYMFMNVMAETLGYAHNGVEVNLQEPISSDNNMGVTLSKIEDRLDYDTGLTELRSPWAKSRRKNDISYFLDGLTEQRYFRERFQRIGGKASKFYQPTWQYDFEISSVSGDTLSVFVPIGSLDAYDQISDAFGVLDNDGYWRFFNIESVTETIQGEYRFDLDEQFVVAIKDIALISFIRLSRFDQDEATLTFVGDDCAELTMTVLEV